MAKAKSSPAAPKTATTKALVPRASQELEPWEAEALQEASTEKEAVSGVGGGLFISFKQGKLMIGDNEVPGNRIGCVIVAFQGGRAYYSGAYNPKATEGPKCFAFGELKQGVVWAPHEGSEEQQSDNCISCPNNAFGSATQGKGKACREFERIAVIPAGEFDDAGGFIAYDDPARFVDEEMATGSIPITSVIGKNSGGKGFAAYIGKCQDIHRKPVKHMITQISCRTDPNTQIAVEFEAIAPIREKAIADAINARVAAAQEMLTRPFPKIGAKEETKAPAAPAMKVNKSKLR